MGLNRERFIPGSPLAASTAPAQHPVPTLPVPGSIALTQALASPPPLGSLVRRHSIALPDFLLQTFIDRRRHILFARTIDR